jgi:hypothetical protein
MTAFNWVCSCVDGDIEVVRADEHDALQARLAATERLLLVARDCLRTAHNGWAEALGREIHAFLGATAVQPERCCLDYPRCDCNSPPEPDSPWPTREEAEKRAAELMAIGLYNELLYAVASKYPGESRHDTALRYIRDRETRPSNGPSQAVEPKL